MGQGVSGRIIIEQLVRNMEIGQFELGYSVLLPCIFSIYLHPDDYQRLAGIQELIKEDARRALSARMARWNSKSGLFGRKEHKQFKIASKDWCIEFFPDTEATVPLGDVEIHSELNELPEPGYRGTKTTLLGREPSVTGSRPLQQRVVTRRAPEKILAEIRYEDDSGPQVYFVTKEEITVGRGGEDLTVDLPLYTKDEVSREHLRLRHDAQSGRFFIVDGSMNGTWLNGRRLARDVEEALPGRAEIGVAEVLTLSFEVK